MAYYRSYFIDFWLIACDIENLNSKSFDFSRTALAKFDNYIVVRALRFEKQSHAIAKAFNYCYIIFILFLILKINLGSRDESQLFEIC